MTLRRPLVATLAACLVLGAAAAPVAAKRPKKKPVRFEESGTLTAGHPGDDAGGINVTRTAFLRSCAVPDSQGTDGYVIELPPAIGASNSNVRIKGVDPTGPYDLDIHFFDESCASTGSLSSNLPDEFGLMPEGTRYVLVTAFMGADIGFSFRAEGV